MGGKLATPNPRSVFNGSAEVYRPLYSYVPILFSGNPYDVHACKISALHFSAMTLHAWTTQEITRPL